MDCRQSCGPRGPRTFHNVAQTKVLNAPLTQASIPAAWLFFSTSTSSCQGRQGGVVSGREAVHFACRVSGSSQLMRTAAGSIPWRPSICAGTWRLRLPGASSPASAQTRVSLVLTCLRQCKLTYNLRAADGAPLPHWRVTHSQTCSLSWRVECMCGVIWFQKPFTVDIKDCIPL